MVPGFCTTGNVFFKSGNMPVKDSEDEVLIESETCSKSSTCVFCAIEQFRLCAQLFYITKKTLHGICFDEVKMY